MRIHRPEPSRRRDCRGSRRQPAHVDQTASGLRQSAGPDQRPESRRARQRRRIKRLERAWRNRSGSARSKIGAGWIHPAKGCWKDFSLGSYLMLVDYTGRLFRDGKAAISAEVSGILERLGSSAEQLVGAAGKTQQGPAAGPVLRRQPRAPARSRRTPPRAPPGQSRRMPGEISRLAAQPAPRRKVPSPRKRRSATNSSPDNRHQSSVSLSLAERTPLSRWRFWWPAAVFWLHSASGLWTPSTT